MSYIDLGTEWYDVVHKKTYQQNCPKSTLRLYVKSWNKEENEPNEDELQQTVETID